METETKTKGQHKTLKDPPVNEKWLIRRRETFFMSLVVTALIGMQYTMLYSTLWSYLTVGMNLANPHLYYGLILGGRYIFSICLNLVISRWFDIDRRLKFCAILINISSILGYMLYLIPTSPYFTMAGTTLLGPIYILQTLMNSEMLRVYEGYEMQAKFFMTMVAYGVGELIGPICVKLMDKVDFHVGGLRIMYGNAPALLLLYVNFINLLLTFCFVHDVSSEYDLKAHKAHLKEVPENTVSFREGILILKETIDSIDMCFVLAIEFFIVFVLSILAQIIPLIMQPLLYSNFAVGIWFFGASATMILANVVITKMKPSIIDVYFTGIISVVSLLFSNIAMLLIKNRLGRVTNTILLSVLAISYAISWSWGNTFIIVTIGKMCSSSRQSFVEGQRLVMNFAACFIAALTAAFVYEQLVYCSAVFLVVNVIILLGMFKRWKTLSDPKIEDASVPLVSVQ